MTAKKQEADLWPDCQFDTYLQANEIGRERAETMIDRMRRTDNPSLLGITVEAIAKGGIFGGVEIGFFHVVATTLMQGQIKEFIGVPTERAPSLFKLGHLAIVG